MASASSRATRDIVLLFVTRTLRLAAYGTIGVVLALFLNAAGLSDREIGLLLFLTLIGDSAVSLFVTRHADAARRAWLASSCLLMAGAGLAFGLAPRPSFGLLLAAATLGVISPSGNEVGPFLSLEQSILSELVSPETRTHVFAWYNLVGYSATALGSLGVGHALVWARQAYGISDLDGYRAVFVQYAGCGLVLLGLFLLLTDRVERPERRRKPPPSAPVPAELLHNADAEAGLTAPLLQPTPPDPTAATSEHEPEQPSASDPSPKPATTPDPVTVPATSPSTASTNPAAPSAAPAPPSALGLSPRSHRIVSHLALLCSLDSLAGGLVTGTLLAYFFSVRYGVSTAYLGGLLFGANMLAAVSSLASGFVAARFGLVNTMVFTHLPSNVLMLLVPLMPNLTAATAMVFARYSISQMDVAPRSAYIAGVVRPEERTAAMGVVNIAKSVGAAFGPLITGWLAQQGLFDWAFYGCGGGKIVYDLLLLWSFSHIKPEH
ncbi:hypothetical protein HYH03_018211 [Edaphochlamys debaryana]|uniref:Major facilitator superfamily (MFS) profile domain-containing protein n=1 Tax=Edaphochlamys debaryana TaxID=47281 RepID=A0A835XFP5_9CHLO|nr:hypothetical protein HYH03_018211 [Edaphochlamys debaryana]|eukprot:KAG2482866.1 hypothetical protein HYH03_018211 [Edaphochlamys debaryana]